MLMNGRVITLMIGMGLVLIIVSLHIVSRLELLQ
jgi:hypothetical protein